MKEQEALSERPNPLERRWKYNFSGTPLTLLVQRATCAAGCEVRRKAVVLPASRYPSECLLFNPTGCYGGKPVKGVLLCRVEAFPSRVLYTYPHRLKAMCTAQLF